MKIAVSASGNDLESLVNPLFGRCPYFVIVDTKDMTFEAFENLNMAVSDDAGVQSAQFVVSKGARVVITGKCGPRAVQTLLEEGIEIVVDLMGTVRQVVEKYKSGDLITTDKANVEERFGILKKDCHATDRNQDHEDGACGSSGRPWFGYVRLNKK